ncbi:MAG: hypothetical protein EBR79_02475, partial [Proteobacteria bacterium]|nr:hypothetical protein [Pseudomonadota bacterium]
MQAIQKKQAVVSADGTLLMLLSLNFLLLAFFILLNGMATRDQAGRGKDMLAQVREGYDVAGPFAEDGTLPRQPRQEWQQGLQVRVQGLVSNRLGLTTVPLEVDAERLVMRFPLGEVFDGEKLRRPEMVRNLMAAAGRDSVVRWEVSGPLAQGAELAAQAGQLAIETGAVAVRGGLPEVRAVFIPQ